MTHHSQTEKRSENKNGNALTARYYCAMIIGLSDGPVAQLDRVSDSDSEGRAFESRRVRQMKKALSHKGFRAFFVLFFYCFSGCIYATWGLFGRL